MMMEPTIARIPINAVAVPQREARRRGVRKKTIKTMVLVQAAICQMCLWALMAYVLHAIASRWFPGLLTLGRGWAQDGAIGQAHHTAAANTSTAP